MGYLKRLSNAIFNRNVDFEQLYYQLHATNSGTAISTVTPNVAMQMTAVFACVKLISQSIGMLPLNIYKSDGKTRQIATNHPIYPLLKAKPNQDMNTYQFKEAIAAAMCLQGAGYIQKVRSVNGKILELNFLLPQSVGKQRVNGKISYTYTDYIGTTHHFTNDEVINIPYFSIDGINGLSPISVCRESVKLGLTTEKHANLFYENGGKPNGAVEVPTTLTDAAYDRLKTSFNESYGGSNSYKTAIFEGGAKWANITMTARDAEFIATRKFQISEIARIFSVPPHLIGDLDKATFSNIEQQNIEFATYTIAPLTTKIEDALNAYLLTESELQQGFYFRFDLSALLKGDLKSRFDSYAVARQWGWMSANEIRALEDQNPIEGGDIFLKPLNMGDLKDPTPPPKTEPTK